MGNRNVIYFHQVVWQREKSRLLLILLVPFFFLTMAISEFKYQFSNVEEHTNRSGKKKQDFP